MAERRVLGIDVGPTSCGWGLIESTGRQGRARYVSGGKVASQDIALLGLLESTREGCNALGLHLGVAVESPEGHVHHQERGAQLMRTSNVAGRVAFGARMLRLPTLEMSAQCARRAICGKGVTGVPGDRLVKHAMRLYVEGLPARTSTHVRDALLVACVALFNPGRVS